MKVECYLLFRVPYTLYTYSPLESKGPLAVRRRSEVPQVPLAKVLPTEVSLQNIVQRNELGRFWHCSHITTKC